MNFLKSLSFLITANTNWFTSPDDDIDAPLFPGTIREFKEAWKEREAKEHEVGGTAAADGWHKSGAHVIYFSSSEPTYRPDGVTTLDSEDAGRLWYNNLDNELFVYSGSSWDSVSTSTSVMLITGAQEVTGDKTFSGDPSFSGGFSAPYIKAGVVDIGYTLGSLSFDYGNTNTVTSQDIYDLVAAYLTSTPSFIRMSGTLAQYSAGAGTTYYFPVFGISKGTSSYLYTGYGLYLVNTGNMFSKGDLKW